MVHSITYDLHAPGRSYGDVIGAIKRKAGDGMYASALESVWFVDTLDDTATWTDFLTAHVDGNDELFVGRIQARSWASMRMDDKAAEWLKSPGRRW
ncbi:MAG: hypothetical protein V7607_5064 [Solirubrobacteraceae bacterium]